MDHWEDNRREGEQVVKNLEKLASLSQNLQPLMMVLSKLQAGDASALKQVKEFVEEHADHILQARPVLESEGLVTIVRQFVPNVDQGDLKRAVRLLLDYAEQTVRRRQ
ncbi:MAG: hypothetical protein GX855_03965 [Firmicutes bacterium]|nr:hypothetical protein [Bacillota bacterium]